MQVYNRHTSIAQSGTCTFYRWSAGMMRTSTARERLERGPGGFPVATLIVFAIEGFHPARANECTATRGFLMRQRVGGVTPSVVVA